MAPAIFPTLLRLLRDDRDLDFGLLRSDDRLVHDDRVFLRADDRRADRIDLRRYRRRMQRVLRRLDVNIDRAFDDEITVLRSATRAKKREGTNKQQSLF